MGLLNSQGELHQILKPQNRCLYGAGSDKADARNTTRHDCFWDMNYLGPSALLERSEGKCEEEFNSLLILMACLYNVVLGGFE